MVLIPKLSLWFNIKNYTMTQAQVVTDIIVFVLSVSFLALAVTILVNGINESKKRRTEAKKTAKKSVILSSNI